MKHLALCCMTAIILFDGCRKIKTPTISVGQVWEYQSDKTPFPDCQKGILKTYTVLDIKDGWVKWRDERGTEGCDTAQYFIAGAHHLPDK